jgi:hypothetical protein
MRSPVFRTLLTALILALLLAPEAMLLHQCPCGRILSCCCRTQLKAGEVCQLHHPGMHCSGGSRSVPGSLQSLREPIDRPGASPVSLRQIRLAFAGWTAEAARGALFDRVPDPPLPPPRPLQAT